MEEKKKKILQISSFILVIIMLALFSVGTILMTMPKQQKGEDRLVQFAVSGDPLARIKKFEILNNTVKFGEKIPAKIEVEILKDMGKDKEPVVTDDYNITGYAIWGKEVRTGGIFYGNYNEKEGYISGSIPGSGGYLVGTFKITGLTVFLERKDGVYDPNNAIAYVQDKCETELECENYKFLQQSFTVEPKKIDDVPIYEYTVGLKETNPERNVGEKLDVVLKRIDRFEEIYVNRKELKSMMLAYTNETDNSSLNVYVKSIDNNPYIIIPSTATAGKYNLDYGYLTFLDDTSARYQNTEEKTFSYNTSFIVKEEKFDTTKYSFNNENYNANVLKDLEKLDKDAIITVNANAMPIINSELFEIIQNTKRTLIIEYEDGQWIFNGIDINSSKSIDVSMILSDLESDEYYDGFLKENVTGSSALLKFFDNGDLPGKALIKLNSDKVNSYLIGQDKAYVYYYKKDTDELVKVALEVQANNGFYEFYINHNSMYIITGKEIKAKAVSDSTEILSLNQTIQSQQQLPLTYILATACGALAMLLLVVLLTRGRKQQQQQTTQG